MKKIIVLALCIAAGLQLSAQTVTRKTCVLENGVLKEIEYDYNTTTGAKTVTVNGVLKNIDEVYPETGQGYAAGTPWYAKSEPIIINGARYVKWGLPRVQGTDELQPHTTYNGAVVCTEKGTTGIPGAVYVAIRRDCEFQPYELDLDECDVKVKAVPELSTVTSGKDVVVNAEVNSKHQNLNYTWRVSIFDGQYWYEKPDLIIGAADTKTVKLTSKGAGKSVRISLMVSIPGQLCRGVTHTIEVAIN